MKNLIKVIGLSTAFMLAHANPSGSTSTELNESSSKDYRRSLLSQKLGETKKCDLYRTALIVTTLGSSVKDEKTLQELRIRALQKAVDVFLKQEDVQAFLKALELYTPGKMLDDAPRKSVKRGRFAVAQ